jgi:hypothetical protein
MHTRARVCPRTHTHTHMHVRARTHTHHETILSAGARVGPVKTYSTPASKHSTLARVRLFGCSDLVERRSMMKGVSLSSHCIHLLDSMLDWNPSTRESAASLLTFPFFADVREPDCKFRAVTSSSLTDSELFSIVGLVFQAYATQIASQERPASTRGAKTRVNPPDKKSVARANRRHKSSKVNDAASLTTIEEDPLGEVSWSSVGTSSSSNSSASSRVSSRNRSGASSCPTRTPTKTPRSTSPGPKLSQVINDVLKQSLSPGSRTPPPRSRAASPAAGASPAASGGSTPSRNAAKSGDSPSPEPRGADDALAEVGQAQPAKRAQSIWATAAAAALVDS